MADLDPVLADQRAGAVELDFDVGAQVDHRPHAEVAHQPAHVARGEALQVVRAQEHAGRRRPPPRSGSPPRSRALAAPPQSDPPCLVVVPATLLSGKGTPPTHRAPFTVPPAGSGRAAALAASRSLLGVAALRPGGSVRTEAIHEHRVLLVDVGAAVVLLRRALVLPRLGVLDGHAVVRPRFPPLFVREPREASEQRKRDPTRTRSVYARGSAGGSE